MPYSAVGKNKLLDYLATLALRVSLHSGDPGATGILLEFTGGSPAYARKAIAWNAAAAGSLDSSDAPVFDVPAGETVSYVGFWNTAGTEYYGAANVTDEVYAGQGTYTLSDADLDLNS